MIIFSVGHAFGWTGSDVVKTAAVLVRLLVTLIPLSTSIIPTIGVFRSDTDDMIAKIPIKKPARKQRNCLVSMHWPSIGIDHEAATQSII